MQGGEVAYVDAQRNVAVALGERDVKTDVTKVGLVTTMLESPSSISLDSCHI